MTLLLVCGALVNCFWTGAVTAQPPARRARRPPQRAPARAFAAREAAYRANNRGVALLEQFKAKEAVAEFQRALSIEPQLALAQVNLAIALYNVPERAAALRAAEAARQLAPAAPQPDYLIGLIARADNRPQDAIAAFERVLAIDPRDAGALVNLGQARAQLGQHAEAADAFRAALAAEPYNITALYNLGTTLVRLGRRDEGRRFLERSQALRQSGAGTITGQNYLEQGRYAEAVVTNGAEPDLVDPATPAVTFTDATARLLPATPGRAPRPQLPPAPLFTGPAERATLDADAQSELLARFGGGVTLFDFDGDGALDLFALEAAGARLYRNERGRFVDVTQQAGALKLPLPGTGLGACAGDYDNDGRADLLVLHSAGVKLLHNDGGARFSDVTRSTGLAAYPYLSISAAFADVDHDGDLDIFIAGFLDRAPAKLGHPTSTDAATFPQNFPGAPNMLWRNNGNGTFTDISAAAQVAGAGAHAVAVVPTDYDNRRDVDLLVLNYGARPTLLRNMRDGTFRDVATEAGLDRAAPYTSAAAGDVNKDGYTDFYFGAADASGFMALSDGQGRFVLEPAPTTVADATNAQFVEHDAAQFLDYDNDGLLDFVRLSIGQTTGGLNIWRNVGRAWTDVSERTLPRNLRLVGGDGEPLQPRVFAAGDVDADGDTDLFVRSAFGALKLLRNDGGNRNRSIHVRLAGRVSNRSAVEAKIELRAGSLQQRLETYAAYPAPAPADLLFGLGQRNAPDAVRVLWPSGTVQAETELAPGRAALARRTTTRTNGRGSALASVTVTELDRKPSSCPFLYTWNGARFEFVTDFMGGGEMGDWLAPGLFNTPDPDEYVRIRADQLKPRNGRYELRVTNELEEALYVDRLQLVAVAHPAGVNVYPAEGLRDAPPPFKLYTTSAARPPRAAHDEHEHDVRAQIAKLDRLYPDDFTRHPIRGYAAPHTLTLDLGLTEQAAQRRVLLLLTGWTDYAYSSDNVAAAQQQLAMQPPALQVKDEQGAWRTVIENIGIPVGRPQTLVVELTGKLRATSSEVRIVTNMRVYWDQILVDTSGGDAPLALTRLEPARAELHWRGFSQEVAPDGRTPTLYDYARVSRTTPWRVFPGRYTREGDVRELLTAADDMFVVARTGDELSLSFDAGALAPLAPGWTRTFLLYADGFSKEMNIQSASPDMLAPLPFHAMTRYPYTAPEAYPLTPARAAYIERYNTRVVTRPLAQLLTGDR
ncbi:MAG TPA: FG-GAP-like repeat-containing protein [Pyrinomonadaceae bacterium]